MTLSNRTRRVYRVVQSCLRLGTALLVFCGINLLPVGTAATFAAEAARCLLVERVGKVEIAHQGSASWTLAGTNEVLVVGDRLRTGLNSRATLRWSELSIVRVNQLTSMEIAPPEKADGKARLDLKSGATYLFSREKPEEIHFTTPVASGAIRGTEFNLAVAEDGHTVLTLLDGEVDMANAAGGISLKSGEQGTVEKEKIPTKTAVLDGMGVIQWALYYPSVVNLDEIGLSPEEEEALSVALKAYRSGDLLAALTSYPANRETPSEAERALHASLLLAVGQVEQAEADLARLGTNSASVRAHREIIALVRGRRLENLASPAGSSEYLARSYTLQARSQLNEALAAAREAARLSPSSGAAWLRVAELEFGLNHTPEALAALDKGLKLSPRNAQGLALKGFVLSAQGQTSEAMSSFDQAIAADGALANAWLGRGLVKIYLGDAAAGRADLQVAAALEPQRAVLRSYLGKAFGNAGDLAHAEKELALAQKLDPNDPTAPLYSALLSQQQNRINKAAEDLEKSKELNGNRSIFRSDLLLDQDQAVRSANLAGIYRDAGMFDVSIQEAAQAVNYDYLNASAHQFLASSYDYLRDPKLINLRYETPAFSEYLVANLLAPAGGGGLAQTVSQQEYSRLFDADHFGLFSDTEYASRGDWLQNASQYGIFGNTSYALNAYYRTQNGFRPNNDLELGNFGGQVKHYFTPQDSVYLEVSALDVKSGDVSQYYSQSQASTTLRVKERQTPNVLFGYHHQWAPGLDTLVFAGRFNDTLEIGDPAANVNFLRTQVNVFTGATNVTFTHPPGFDLDYTRKLDAYTAELQQVWQTSENTLVVGGRYQTGALTTESSLDRSFAGTTSAITAQDIDSDLWRVSLYGYDTWRVLEQLQLTAGLSYDQLHYPRNIDTSPITADETTTDQVSPKAGFSWTPFKNTQFRGVYTRSLGGFSLDQSVRLEPTQIAGFTQAFRSLIPESVAGQVPAAPFETFGLGWNQKLSSRTYVVLDGQVLKSDPGRTVGLLTNSNPFGPIADSPTSTRQSFQYNEKSVSLAINQFLDDEVSLGARYQLTYADLQSRFDEIDPTVPGVPNADVSATLQQLWLFAIYNHPCGFFAAVDGIWSTQVNHGYSGTQPGDTFWQGNVHVGYHFWNRRAQVRFSVLNVGDRDYKLNPLTLYNELPRERLFVAGFTLAF